MSDVLRVYLKLPVSVGELDRLGQSFPTGNLRCNSLREDRSKLLRRHHSRRYRPLDKVSVNTA